MNTKKNSPACIVLGRGVLSWYPIERISDRYGSVVLYGNVDGSDQSTFDIGRFAGKTGSLIAVVFETRKSHHVGDLFRGQVSGRELCILSRHLRSHLRTAHYAAIASAAACRCVED